MCNYSIFTVTFMLLMSKEKNRDIMKYVLCETASKQKYNAAKAREDFKKIAVQSGYREITLFHNGYFKPYIICEIIFGCLKLIFCADKNDIVLIQYPYYPKWVNRLFFGLLRVGKRIKKYQVNMLVHDILALRQKDSKPDTDLELLAGEIQSWSWVDRVICHNVNMLKILKKAHTYDQYDVLGIFYYLYDGPVCKRIYHDVPRIVIAGNLDKEKCGYIYQLKKIHNVLFDLYGTNYSGEETENIRYCGVYPPDELIAHLKGHFGLVWDGDSIDTCSGDPGEYLKYNAPHKFSLYIAANLPVIVWEQSALSDYVKENNVGICINSLFDLPLALRNISEKQYQKMCQNTENIRKDIITGQLLKKII